MPLPALPAPSWMPVLSMVMTLVASVTPTVGVNVAVNVTPPLLDETGPSVAF